MRRRFLILSWCILVGFISPGLHADELEIIRARITERLKSDPVLGKTLEKLLDPETKSGEGPLVLSGPPLLQIFSEARQERVTLKPLPFNRANEVQVYYSGKGKAHLIPHGHHRVLELPVHVEDDLEYPLKFSPPYSFSLRTHIDPETFDADWIVDFGEGFLAMIKNLPYQYSLEDDLRSHLDSLATLAPEVRRSAHHAYRLQAVKFAILLHAQGLGPSREEIETFLNKEKSGGKLRKELHLEFIDLMAVAPNPIDLYTVLKGLDLTMREESQIPAPYRLARTQSQMKAVLPDQVGQNSPENTSYWLEEKKGVLVQRNGLENPFIPYIGRPLWQIPAEVLQTVGLTPDGIVYLKAANETSRERLLKGETLIGTSKTEYPNGLEVNPSLLSDPDHPFILEAKIPEAVLGKDIDILFDIRRKSSKATAHLTILNSHVLKFSETYTEQNFYLAAANSLKQDYVRTAIHILHSLPQLNPNELVRHFKGVPVSLPMAYYLTQRLQRQGNEQPTIELKRWLELIKNRPEHLTFNEISDLRFAASKLKLEDETLRDLDSPGSQKTPEIEKLINETVLKTWSYLGITESEDLEAYYKSLEAAQEFLHSRLQEETTHQAKISPLENLKAFVRIAEKLAHVRQETVTTSNLLQTLSVDNADAEAVEIIFGEPDLPYPTRMENKKARYFQTQFKEIFLKYLENTRENLIISLKHYSADEMVREINQNSFVTKVAFSPISFDLLSDFNQWHRFVENEPKLLARLEKTRDLFELVDQVRETLEIGKIPKQGKSHFPGNSLIAQIRDQLRLVTDLRHTVCFGESCRTERIPEEKFRARLPKSSLIGRFLAHGLFLFTKDKVARGEPSPYLNIHFLSDDVRASLAPELKTRGMSESLKCGTWMTVLVKPRS